MSTLTATAAVFQSGNSQAIRLPKSFRVNSSRVILRKVGNDIVISEKIATMKEFLDALPIIPDWPDSHEDGPEEPVEPW
jgi:antitoxin VapB